MDLNLDVSSFIMDLVDCYYNFKGEYKYEYKKMSPFPSLQAIVNFYELKKDLKKEFNEKEYKVIENLVYLDYEIEGIDEKTMTKLWDSSYKLLYETLNEFIERKNLRQHFYLKMVNDSLKDKFVYKKENCLIDKLQEARSKMKSIKFVKKFL